MAVYRTERLAHVIQECIASLIIEQKIKDPRVNSFLSVTRVSVSRDLAWADVHISTFRPEESLTVAVEGLQHAAGFIQSQLAVRLHIRRTPRLRFHADKGIREEFELAQKIDLLVQNTPDSSLSP
ncbi:MAG: 30S ribosome-binding factor RbfA [Treponema sp.]|jgi:ribosome-binding factor A|nr:30S ribosome-binding factor RbfA [Treponema sp.]